MLSTEELERMVTKARETFRYEEPPSEENIEEEEAWEDDLGPSRLVFALSIAVSFFLGAAGRCGVHAAPDALAGNAA